MYTLSVDFWSLPSKEIYLVSITSWCSALCVASATCIRSPAFITSSPSRPVYLMTSTDFYFVLHPISPSIHPYHVQTEHLRTYQHAVTAQWLAKNYSSVIQATMLLPKGLNIFKLIPVREKSGMKLEISTPELWPLCAHSTHWPPFIGDHVSSNVSVWLPWQSEHPSFETILGCIWKVALERSRHDLWAGSE